MLYHGKFLPPYMVEKSLKDKIIEGNNSIIEISKDLGLTKKTIITSQIIFNYIYPKVSETDNVLLVVCICIFLSSKIEETRVNLEKILDIAQKSSPIIKKDFLEREIAIIKLMDYNFDFNHAHYYLLKIIAFLQVNDYKSYWDRLDAVHASDKVNLINYFGKSGLEPELVAFSLFDENHLRIIENDLYLSIDRDSLKNAQRILFNKDQSDKRNDL